MRWIVLACVVEAGLLGCSSSSGGGGAATGGAGGVGGRAGAGGAAGVGPPSQAADTNPANPHVTTTPPPNPAALLQAAADAGATAADGGTGPFDAQPDVAPGGGGGIPATWPTTDCPGGPCAAPKVCVNLDFLFVACVPCGDVDQVCCPFYATSIDPWLGTCKAGLVCGANPNLHTVPPFDLVARVCQVPGSPPPTDGGFNHQREMLSP